MNLKKNRARTGGAKAANKRKDRKRRTFRRKLKFMIIALCIILFLAETVPPTLADPVSINRTFSYYGFFEEHQRVLDEKSDRINSPQIIAETQDRLDGMQTETINPRSELSEFNVDVKGVPLVNPEDRLPPILDATHRSTIWNKSTVLEFLIDQPLNYMIMTFYGNHTVLTKALLRQSLLIPEPDFGSDWGWKEIDVDNNASTGTAGGHEIRARLRFKVENITTPSIADIFNPPLSIIIEGSLVVEIEKLVDIDLPLHIYFMKYASSEGKNFVISIGYYFNNAPTSFSASTLIKKIVLEDLGQKLVLNLINRITSNISSANIGEVSGPYTIYYETSSNLTNLEVTIAMIRIEDFELADWSWVKLMFYNKPSLPSIPKNGELWLNNTELYAPIDTVIWTAGPFDERERIPSLFGIEFYEMKDSLIYAIGMIDEMPPHYKMAMDYTQEVDGQDITYLEYETDYKVDKIEYYAYEFPFYLQNGNYVDFNVSHVLFRDLPLKFTFEVTADVGRNLNSTIDSDPASGIMANLIDNLIIRVARRFYRIGDSLKTLATSITTLPARQGWAELNVESGYLGLASIYRSSGKYAVMENDFVSFYNQTNERIPGTLVDFPIAAKLRDLKYFKASFKDDTEIVLKTRGGRPFSIAFLDHDDFAYAEFSDLPSEIALTLSDYDNSYLSYCVDSPQPGIDCDFSSEGAVLNRIDEFNFYSRSGKQYMELNIFDIPNVMNMIQDGDTIYFDAGEEDYVGGFEFFITDNLDYPIQKLKGQHYALVDIQPEYSAASGRLTGLQMLVYQPGEDGRTEMRLKDEVEFNIKMTNNIAEPIDASIILDPLPSHFKMELPGTINSSIRRFPDVVNVTGEVDFSNVVFAISNIGNSIINIMNNISQNVVETLGAVSTDLSFSYELESFGSTLDIIAQIQRGKNERLPDLNWSHGIIMAASGYGDTTALKGNIYLQGLPPKANFTSTFGQDDVYLDLQFEDYRPKYDWLYVERKGLQDRNLNFYLDGLATGMDLEFSINLTTNVSIGGKTSGTIDIQSFYSGNGTPLDLGTLHVSLHRLDAYMSKTEVFISEIPSTFSVDVAMFRDAEINYQASKSIEYIYIDISKKLDSEWFNTYLLFHDIPTWFDVSMKANTDYRISKPLPLQGMPEFSIECGSRTMDIIGHTSGRASGQRGDIDIVIENVNSLTSKLDGEYYSLKSSGLDYISLKMMNMPLMENFNIIELELKAEDLKSVKIKISTIFGVYPMFELSDLNGNAIEIRLDHEMDLFGSTRRATIVLVDVTYSSRGAVDVPSGTPVHNNGLAIELDNSKRHVLLPAPFISLTMSSF
jgi:hypothetical protein